MEITDFADVDYIEIINNPEPLHEVNVPGILWWESLVLKGEKLAACAGMDLHTLDDMSMKFATYAQGEEGGDAVSELRTAIAEQKTWVSKGMLVTWVIENGEIRFELCDVHKPGFVPQTSYILTLKNRDGEREFDITSGSLVLSLDELGEIEIPKLYGGEPTAENLICVAPAIRKN